MSAGKRSGEKAIGETVKVRKCLRCPRKFKSYCKSNRLCRRCKAKIKAIHYEVYGQAE